MMMIMEWENLIEIYINYYIKTYRVTHTRMTRNQKKTERIGRHELTQNERQ